EVDLAGELCELYERLCQEADWSEPGDATEPTVRRDLDISFLDRDLLARELAVVRTALADRAAAFAQVEERAKKAEAELEATQRTVDELGERLAGVLGEYLPGESLELVGRVRAIAREVLPAGATALVLSEGDERLIRLRGVSGRHFPRLPDGQHADFHPAGDTSAIAQLEVERG